MHLEDVLLRSKDNCTFTSSGYAQNAVHLPSGFLILAIKQKTRDALPSTARPTNMHTCIHTYIPQPHQLISIAHHCTRPIMSQPTTILFARQLLDFHLCHRVLSFPSPSVDVVTGHHPISLPLRFHHSRIFLRLLLQFSLFPLPPLYPTWVIHNEQ
jgi:hypothetical protein